MGIYTEANTNGWRDLPGPGDEATWGPCRNHPLDPRTPDMNDEAYATTRTELLQERIGDVEGWFVESFSQASPEQLKALSDAVEAQNDIQIRVAINRIVYDYCSPSDEDVTRRMENHVATTDNLNDSRED